MASAVLRSRAWGLLSRHRTPNRRFLSSDAVSMPAAAAGQHHNNADKEFLSSSSQSIIREEAIAATAEASAADAAAAEAAEASAAKTAAAAAEQHRNNANGELLSSSSPTFSSQSVIREEAIAAATASAQAAAPEASAAVAGAAAPEASAAKAAAAAAGQHHNNADKEFFSSSSQSIIGEEAIAAATASAQAAAAAEATAAETAALQKKGGREFLKYGIFGSLIGALGLAGCVTYAYTLDEVDQRTKPLREAATAAAAAAGGDHASAMEKYRGLLYSTAISVPAKVVELYLDSRGQVEEYFRRISDPISDKLLPDMHPQDPRFTLVLDLNETLIYSDWKRERGWRTFKRPGVDAFLQQLAQYYEIVVYTDHLYMFAQPVVERLAQSSPNTISHMLSRDDTKYTDGKHYRDFSKLNRDPNKIIYLSAHGLENSLQREYSLQISPFKLDDKGNAPLDTTLLDLIPFLEYVGRHPPADIRTVLQSYQGKDVAKEFRERSKEFQRRKQEQRHQQQQQQQGWFLRR